MVRVRYAPSPTGHLHIGNARTALFNYMFAKKNNGKFIIRIEDTDISRNIEGGVKSQLEYLNWLGITWDEGIDVGGEFGPYNQISRLDIYNKYVNILLEKKIAYKCYCTVEELEKEREELKSKGIDKIHYSGKCRDSEEKDLPYTVRIKIPKNKDYKFNDIVKGEVVFKSEDIGDFVIMKENKIPTYNFACVIDDHLMKITHVLRGEDHITNTPKQMEIYDALGFVQPTFGHMTLITNEDGKKLSKRDEGIIQFISQYKELGYIPNAMFNFISLLGYSPDSKNEIMSMDDLIKTFDENRLSKSPAFFDKNKLQFINNRYIKDMNEIEYLELCKSFINNDLDKFNDVVLLFKDRISNITEINDLVCEFIDKEFSVSAESIEFIKENNTIELIKLFKDKLNDKEFDVDNIKLCIKESGKELSIKGKPLFMSIRLATTNMMHGPDLPKFLLLFNKDEIIKRIDIVISKLV